MNTIIKLIIMSVSLISKILTSILALSLLFVLSSCSNLKNETRTKPVASPASVKNTSLKSETNTNKTIAAEKKPITIIKLNDEWQYKKGNSAAHKNWYQLNFDDSNWLTGKAGFGYGDGDDMTVIHDMMKHYPTLYIRKKFNYSGDYSINTMQLHIYYDDGFIAYLNGHEVARVGMPDGEITHLTTAKKSHEASNIVAIDISKFENLIKIKNNVLAIEVHNSSVNSSDLSLNPSLIFNSDSSSIKPKLVKNTSKKYKQKKPKRNSFCNFQLSCGSIGGYKIKTAFKTLSFIPNDLSGITYVEDSNSFFLIDNGFGSIYEVDPAFKLIRKIKTKGFGDSEDIVYLGNHEFAIVNEHSKLYIGTISADVITLNAIDFQEITFDTYKGNQGAEGVAFDITTQTFYIVKEERPRKLYSFVRPAHKNNVTIKPSFPFDIQRIPYPRLTQDLSAITFNPLTGRLLILSDRDYRVMDIDLDGTVYGVLQLPQRKQPEGITLDNNLNLYIVGEPNNYTIFNNPN